MVKLWSHLVDIDGARGKVTQALLRGDMLEYSGRISPLPSVWSVCVTALCGPQHSCPPHSSLSFSPGRGSSGVGASLGARPSGVEPRCGLTGTMAKQMCVPLPPTDRGAGRTARRSTPPTGVARALTSRTVVAQMGLEPRQPAPLASSRHWKGPGRLPCLGWRKGGSSSPRRKLVRPYPPAVGGRVARGVKMGGCSERLFRGRCCGECLFTIVRVFRCVLPFPGECP